MSLQEFVDSIILPSQRQILRLLQQYPKFGEAYCVNYLDLSQQIIAPHKYYLQDALAAAALSKKLYFTRCGEYVFITPRVSLDNLEAMQ